MPYKVNFTDADNKTAITVFDNTSSTDTSLTFPGRNVTGYGQVIAENFLKLLENFANANAPVNPIEGQLWYDSSNGFLQLWDNTNWKAASSIQKSLTEPSATASKSGELWVDTVNQQLRIFTGTRWILVGPTESSIDGLRHGPVVTQLTDSDNISRTVLIFYIADIPVTIISKDSFTPKTAIAGFIFIRAGINVNRPDPAHLEEAQILGGYLPKLYATASNADALNVLGVEIPAGLFLRSDTINTMEEGLRVRNNAGVTVGIDETFSIGASSTSANIYNSAVGSSIDIQTNITGIPSTIIRVLNNRVGINRDTPDEVLDVSGNFKLDGIINSTNTTESSNLITGSIKTLGGMAITKNLLIGTDLTVFGTTKVTTISPKETDIYDCGTALSRWSTVRTKSLIAETITGVLTGNIDGNANTATTLKNVTSFRLTGDISSPDILFDGQVGSYTKIFQTSLTANIIRDKVAGITSSSSDEILVYRPSAINAAGGLLKISRDTFVADLGVPIGTIFPFAGTNVPTGYLLCDGAEIEVVRYSVLYDAIGTTYNGETALIGTEGRTYRLPDMRGRFALGRDNMDNGSTVPKKDTTFYVDAGGGVAGRVPDTKAQILGASAGQSATNLTLGNLPDHEHTLRNGLTQYSAIRVDSAINPPATTGLGPTSSGAAQFLNTSGFVKTPEATFVLGAPFGIMNPYLTINYIIRSGPPAF